MEDLDAELVEACEVQIALVLMKRLAGHRRRARERDREARSGQPLGCVEAVPAAAPVGDERRPGDGRGVADRLPGLNRRHVRKLRRLIGPCAGREDHRVKARRQLGVAVRLELELHAGRGQQAPVTERS